MTFEPMSKNSTGHHLNVGGVPKWKYGSRVATASDFTRQLMNYSKRHYWN